MVLSSICTVCKTNIETNYCGTCGQKMPSKKTTVISLFMDLVTNFFSMEKSGFATILKIIWNPKPIIENYYLGYRNHEASPGKILLYGLTSIVIHLTFVNDKILGGTIRIENVAAQYGFVLIFYPILLLISFLSFIRLRTKISKHLISIIYIVSSLLLVITLINDLTILIFGDLFNANPIITFLLLFFIWNSRVLSQKQTILWHTINTIVQILILALVIYFVAPMIKTK